MPAKSTISTIYANETPSRKCPVCFCNNKKHCTHGEELVQLTNFKPFIGCYNKKLYQDLKIPPQLALAIQLFIEERVKILTNKVKTHKQQASKNNASGGGGVAVGSICIAYSTYRTYLMDYFYGPIAAYAKENDILPKDAIISIKQEKQSSSDHHQFKNNKMMTDDMHKTPTKKLTSTTTNNKPRKAEIIKKDKIKKASPKKQSCPLTTSQRTVTAAAASLPNNKIQILIKNRTTKKTNAMLLSEEDFKDLFTFKKALRRNLKLTVRSDFDHLQFQYPITTTQTNCVGGYNVTPKYCHVDVTRDCEVEVLRHIIQNNQQNVIQFSFENKTTTTTTPSDVNKTTSL